MRILLVQPSPFEPGRLGLENILWMSEPVALTQIAAMVPQHEVKILDMRLEEDLVFNDTLLSFRPDVVGTTSMTTDCYQAKALMQIAKGTLGEQVFTIIGGHHPTLAPDDFKEDCVNALCVGEGEETFLELIEHLDSGGDPHELGRIDGLIYRDAAGTWHKGDKRSQARDINTFPEPARHLVKHYIRDYFFGVASPMASMSTSRGCSFDCNFCAIWEFYERKTRFLSAEVICDRLEKMDEKFVFFLDDNFLTNRRRLEKLCDEIERRGIKKFYGTQGRTDFIADHPELMERLRDAGLIMILSGYESNDDDGLAALLKRNNADKNRRAAAIMRDLGIISTGIFMARQEWEEKDFDALYAEINDLGVSIPLVAILTPLPGTQLHKKRYDELLTHDSRLYDLLHTVLPTKIPRSIFYKKLSESYDATWPSTQKGTLPVLKKRPRFWLAAIPGIIRYYKKASNYRRICEDHGSHLRDEIGVIDSKVTIGSLAEDKKRQARQAILASVASQTNGRSADIKTDGNGVNGVIKTGASNKITEVSNV